MPAAPPRVLLRRARVVVGAATGDAGRGDEPYDADVLLDGDRIVDVAPVGGGQPGLGAVDAVEVDLAGTTLMPGLCDAHTHISWPLDFVFNHPEIAAMPDDEHALEVAGVVRTYLEAGYTLLVGAGALKSRVDVLVARAIDKGLIDGPRLWPSGAMLTRRGTIGAGSLLEVEGPDEVRRAVAEQCELGVRSVKLMLSGDGIVPANPSLDTYFDDEMVAAAVDEATAGGAFVTGHARSPESVKIAVRNGVRIVHHGTFLDDEAVEALVGARDDVWVCPGLHYLRQVVAGEGAGWGITAEAVEQSGYPEELRSSIDGLRRLHDAGVRLVAGGDFGHQWTRHGTYAAELAAYVELLGLTPLEALHTATANAGPVVGLPVGRVAPGHLADLVVLDGDPTTDVRLLLDRDRIGAVVKAGEPVGHRGWADLERWATDATRRRRNSRELTPGGGDAA